MCVAKLYLYKGDYLTIRELCVLRGDDSPPAIKIMSNRINGLKWDVERAFDLPVMIKGFPRRRGNETISGEFWKKVVSQLEPLGKCWEWKGKTTRLGYGLFYFDGGWKFAHRIGYVLQGGQLEGGLVLDHLCRNTSCVRKSHLDQVTSRENILKGVGPSAINARKTICLRGHKLPEANKHGRRNCRLCRNWLRREKTRLGKLQKEGDKFSE